LIPLKIRATKPQKREGNYRMQRGRPGTKNIQPGGVVRYSDIPGVQPDPPSELNPDEAQEWRRFWAVAPPGWFPRETWPLLVQLCRHVLNARWLGEAMQEVRAGLLNPRDPDQVKHLETVTRLHEREGRAMTALMEKLRLTTQQRVSVNIAGPQQAEQAPEVQPWMTHDIRPS
jgi:hypothetical protein